MRHWRRGPRLIVHVVAPFWLPPMPLLSSSLIISCIRRRILHAGYWQISPAERARVGRMWSGGRGWFRRRAMLGHGRGPASWSTLTADNNVRCLLRIGVRPACQSDRELEMKSAFVWFNFCENHHFGEIILVAMNV